MPEPNTRFIVVKTWSNWDAIHEQIVDTFVSEGLAQAHANSLTRPTSMSAYIVRPESAGFSDTYFPRGGR